MRKDEFSLHTSYIDGGNVNPFWWKKRKNFEYLKYDKTKKLANGYFDLFATKKLKLW